MTHPTTADHPTHPSTLPALAGLHHLGITVTDIERSTRWYAQMLGMVEWMREPHPAGYTVGMMHPGTPVFLGLDVHNDNAGERFEPHRTGLDHLALGVARRSELDAWRNHLTASGVECGPIKDLTEPVACALFSFTDPDGIALEIIWVDGTAG